MTGAAAEQPTAWRVDAVLSVTDGDTVRLLRSRPVSIDGRHYRLADDPERSPRGIAVRLLWVDTPERGDHPGWETARADLAAWLGRARTLGPITALCYESGGWDRIMADLIDADGGSASQWLMNSGRGGRGWPPYVP